MAGTNGVSVIESCRTCRAFELSDEDANAGECRLHPPVVLVRIGREPDTPADETKVWADDLLTAFPQVQAGDWCLEWEHDLDRALDLRERTES